jgi:hypothetical protein
MNSAIKPVLILASLLPSATLADTIYSCKEDVSAELSMELFKGKMEGHVKEVPKNPRTITFVVGNKKAIVKNVLSEQEELKELARNVYYDYGHSNTGIWTIVPALGNTHTYIFYQTTVEGAGPLALEFAYICQ